jgi:CubicO group peptidase (beta-lactamase class C family)
MCASPHGTEFDVEALSTHVARELERFRLPAVEVVVVREGEVLFAGGFGRRDVERDLAVTSRTVFAHGSTGKAFTSFLVGQLVDEGVLDWDRPIRDDLPDFKLADPVASERITLRDLLCHRSGIPRHDLAWMANPGLDRGDLVRRMRFLEPSKDLRTLFQYCNFGYVAAGFLCGHVTNSTYEEQIRKRIFEPLGMSNTYLSTSEVTELEDHAQPYAERDERIVPIPYRDASNVLPAGGINSCADDTARWLLCQLGGGELDGRQLISRGSLATTHSVQFPLSGIPIPADDAYRVHGYAMGWIVSTYRGRHHLSHAGGIDGFTTEFQLLPTEKIGVAVSGNRTTALPAALCRHLIDRLLGEPARDWGSEMLEQSEKTLAALKEQAVKGRKVVPGTAPAHPLDDYADRYEHPAYGTLEVRTERDRLAVSLGTIGFQVSHRHYETYDLKWTDLGDLSFSATFVTGESGSVSEVRCSFEPSVETVRFKRVADQRLTDEKFLEGLAGRYTLGPVTVEIVVESGPKLVAYQNGTRIELVPSGGLRYIVPMAPGLTVEFDLDHSGRATAISTSQGILRRAD